MHRVILGLCLVLLALPSLASDAPSVPESISSASEGRAHPVWVDRDLAVQNGKVRNELFSSAEAGNINYLLQSAQALPEGVEGSAEEIARQTECEAYGTLVSRPHPDQPFQALLGRSEIAFEGVVRDQSSGFLFGRPASVLEVEVTNLLKSGPHMGDTQTVLVSFGTAKLVVGDKLICQRSPRYPDEPAVGGRILVFGRTVLSEDPVLVLPDDSSIFFETEAGTVSLPHGSNLVDPPTWSFVEEQLRDLPPATEKGGR